MVTQTLFLVREGNAGTRLLSNITLLPYLNKKPYNTQNVSSYFELPICCQVGENVKLFVCVVNIVFHSVLPRSQQEGRFSQVMRGQNMHLVEDT